MVLSKVGLSGASGMVGGAIIREVLVRGMTGRLSSRKTPEVNHPSLHWSPWDLIEWKTPNGIDNIFSGVDAVIHAGASVPGSGPELSNKQLFDANVRSCLALGEWAIDREVPLVYVSGAVVYEDSGQDRMVETSPVNSTGLGGFYGSTKFLAEQVLFSLGEKGLDLIVLRPTSIYGPGLSKEKMIPKFLRKSLDGEEILLQPPVNDKINLIHSSDVARASLDAIESGVSGVFNLAGPSEVSIEEIANACVVNVGAGRVTIKPGVAPREPTIRYRVSCNKANEKFGYEAKIHLSEGIRTVLLQDFHTDSRTGSEKVIRVTT